MTICGARCGRSLSKTRSTADDHPEPEADSESDEPPSPTQSEDPSENVPMIGIDPNRELMADGGRPIRIVNQNVIEPDILNLFDKRNQPALFGEGALLNKAG